MRGFVGPVLWDPPWVPKYYNFAWIPHTFGSDPSGLSIISHTGCRLIRATVYVADRRYRWRTWRSNLVEEMGCPDNQTQQSSSLGGGSVGQSRHHDLQGGSCSSYIWSHLSVAGADQQCSISHMTQHRNFRLIPRC